MSATDQTTRTWHERALLTTPAGVHSNARLVGRETVFTHGTGPWLFDTAGNRHLDYMIGRGPAFLGHAPQQILDAVMQACSAGLTLGGSTTLEIEAAELALSVIPWADRIRFISSGTEAVQSALRLARAATGRSMIVQFIGQYHGWIDNVSLVPTADGGAAPATGGQSPTSGQHTLLLPWNDIAAVDAAFAEHGSNIAAVITEPVSIFESVAPLPGYLAHLRSITNAHGSVLIFDEVVTGFRLAPGSAAAIVGVEPDIAVYAKAMGSGWPVAAVAGREVFFDGVDTDRVRLSGTYNANTAAVAAVRATVMATADGALHRATNRWGTGLMRALESAAAAQGVHVRCEGYPTAFWLTFEGVDSPTSHHLAETLGTLLREERVIQYHHTWLPTTTHDDEALEVTIAAFGRALKRLTAAM
jgi:glutamate-1-semialdehyde 2,1-aminomutase